MSARVRPVYLDASVLMRVVLDEPGQLAEWESLEDVAANELVEVEGLRTIERASLRATARRKRALTAEEAEAARAGLFKVLEEVDLLALDPTVLALAGRLRGWLGTLDAIHLASAMVRQAQLGERPIIATHDGDLGAAAKAQGFQVIGWTKAG